jgi:hypothetical protein
MGFGVGVLISAVAFDFIEEVAAQASGHGATRAGVFIGCAVFFGILGSEPSPPAFAPAA